MNEIEFLNLMMKRKVNFIIFNVYKADPIWQNVVYVQNYLKTRKTL